MRQGKDGWRKKRRACTFYVPYSNRVVTTIHSHDQDANGKAWTGRCVIKNLPQTSWFTCHECHECQERSKWQVHIINNFTVTARPIRHSKDYELD